MTLSTKRVFIQIGSNDDRVGTGQALHLAELIVSAANQKPLHMTLIITPVKGHATAEQSRAAKWILGYEDAARHGAAPPR